MEGERGEEGRLAKREGDERKGDGEMKSFFFNVLFHLIFISFKFYLI